MGVDIFHVLLSQVVADCPRVLTVEDGCLKGGLYGAVCEWAAARSAQAIDEKTGCDASVQVEGLGIPDRFIAQGTQQELRHDCKIDADGITARIHTCLSR